MAVAIEADQTSFQFYSGGILSAKKCGVKLDHGVLAVGYGTDPKTAMKYWIVKNSWGATWGDKGYINGIFYAVFSFFLSHRLWACRERRGGIFVCELIESFY